MSLLEWVVQCSLVQWLVGWDWSVSAVGDGKWDVPTLGGVGQLLASTDPGAAWGWEWDCKNCLNSLKGCLKLCLCLFLLSWGRKALPRCKLQKGAMGSRMYWIPASWDELAHDASHLPSQQSPTGLICGVSALPEFSCAAVDTRAVVFYFLPLCSPQCFAASLQLKDKILLFVMQAFCALLVTQRVIL